MRNKFDKQLEVLNKDLIEMGALCENAIDCAVRALLDHDLEVADEAIAIEEEINQVERDIETLCLKLLLKQQPVATDLRLISSALKMITDMERIGDQAADIAEIVMHAEIRGGYNIEHLKKMTKCVSKMVTESVDAFVGRNLDLARDVIARDDEVDALFIAINNDLIKYIKEDTENASTALDLLMVVKYLERIGDHAVNIGEWVEFSITGTHRKNVNLKR